MSLSSNKWTPVYTDHSKNLHRHSLSFVFYAKALMTLGKIIEVRWQANKRYFDEKISIANSSKLHEDPVFNCYEIKSEKDVSLLLF